MTRRPLDVEFNRRDVLRSLVQSKKIPRAVKALQKASSIKSPDSFLPSILNYAENVNVSDPVKRRSKTSKSSKCNENKCNENKCKEIKEKKCNKNPCDANNYIITQSDVESTGRIITRPGYYKLCSDIIFNPTTEHTSAIIIAASNVILDFGKHSLIQINKVPNVYGVVVARGVKSVTITGKRNIATIRNFTLAGIRVYGRTQYIAIKNLIVRQDIPVQLTPEEMPVSCDDIMDLSLNLGIAIGEGDTFGVHMQDTFKENLVEQLSIKHVTVEGSTIGCHMIFTFGFEVLKSIFTKNTYYGFLNGTGWAVPGDGPFGLAFPVGGNGIIEDCRFEKNAGLNLDLANPGDLYVFDFVSAVANYEVSNVTVNRCLVADNSNNGYIIAADHDGGRNIKWLNSEITRTTSLFEPADGLHFSGSIPSTVGGCQGIAYPLLQGFNITIDNCTATDGNSGESRAAGFLLAYVQGAHVSNCNASGMVGGQAAGFMITGGLPGGRASNITLVNNTAEQNGAGGFGRAAGFFIRNVSNDIVLKDNIANGNGTGVDLDLGAGFLVEATTNDPEAFIRNIDLDNCTAKGNGNGSEISGGFVIRNATADELPNIENVAIEKSVSKFNNGYGVLITGNVIGASVNESEVYQNTLGGIDVTGNHVFVSRNTAYLNNLNNYNGVALNNIVEGTVDVLPVVDPGFLNVSIY